MASFYNSEGCGCPVDTSAKQKHRPSRQSRNADPTSYYALTKIEQEEKAAQKACCFRPVVYICSPFSGNISNNVQKARLYSRFAVDSGAIPFAPHLLYPQFMSEETERELALFMGCVMLGKCREVWVFGSHISDGMKKEIDKAKQMDKTVRYFTEEMEEVTYEGDALYR